MGQIAADGVAAAQHLEGVQPKTVALILDPDIGHMQFLCKAVQLSQRRNGILRKACMECAHLFGVFRAEPPYRIKPGSGLALIVHSLEALVHLKDLLIDLLKTN